MAMTNAERQRRYRQRHCKDGVKARREFILDAHGDMALDRLVRHYSLPVTSVIERVILEAERTLTEGMGRAEREVYFADQLPGLLAKAARRSSARRRR
jgi:hypothetical protein